MLQVILQKNWSRKQERTVSLKSGAEAIASEISEAVLTFSEFGELEIGILSVPAARSLTTVKNPVTEKVKTNGEN